MNMLEDDDTTEAGTTNDPRIASITGKLRSLSALSDDAIDFAGSFVDKLVENAGAGTASLSADDLKLCRLTGNDPAELALTKAKAKADRELVASLPPPRLAMLRAFVGDDVSKLAARQRETVIAERAARAGR